MKQLAQKLADGRPVVVDVPAPLLGDGMILVQNYYSVVSAGTEGATVRSARKNLIAKALDRPKDVKATLELMKRQGPVQAYRAVMKKLDAYSPLGYSSAGKVIDVAPGVSGFAVGDYVACAGVGYASHAEIVAVPVNLCVKLRPDADMRAAAYNSLGAIALQGVRQADLKLGEKCAVVGLGIVGILACQLLEASGVETFGIDLDPRAVEKARELGFNAQLRQTPGLENEALNVANGIGFDAVIIAAATSSLDPINLAGKILRKKGRVVVLGDVPTGFDRNPEFYPKELELRMSCSYGPGRYDLNYEEKGIDYPFGYVRWTENRNMQAFQELAYKGKIAVDSLTTHVFSLDDAPQAYDMILKRAEYFLGVLLKYDESKAPKRVDVNLRDSSPVDAHKGKIGYAFVGAGSYAQGSLLPNMPQGDLCEPIAILTKSGVSALRVAEKFHFQRVAKDIDDVLDDPNVDLVMIATRHDLHAKLLMRALKKKKRVFVEKPLCLTLDEFLEIRSLFASLGAENAPKIMLGFNRRFSPYSRYLKEALNPNLPMAISYRVNAGAIPLNSWIQDPVLGGGRILGEACHFVDYVSWLSGSAPTAVSAVAIPDPNALNDVVAIQIKMANGSIASIGYYANGSKSLSKERIEVFQGGLSAVVDDFKRIDIYASDGKIKTRKGVQNKGQATMLDSYVRDLKEGRDTIPPAEIFQNTLATFAVLDSLREGKVVSLAETKEYE